MDYNYKGVTSVGFIDEDVNNDRSQDMLKYLYVVTAGKDGYLKIWDNKKGNLVKSIYAHSKPITCMKIYENVIYTASLDKSVKIWNQHGVNLDTFPTR